MSTITVSSGFTYFLDYYNGSVVETTSYLKAGAYSGLAVVARIPITISSGTYTSISFSISNVSLEVSSSNSVVWTINKSSSYANQKSGNLYPPSTSSGSVSLSSGALSGSASLSLSAGTYYLWIYSSVGYGSASAVYDFNASSQNSVATVTLTGANSTLSAPNMTIGSASTITIGGYSSSYTYKLSYSTNNGSSYTSISTSASASTSWTPPTTLLNSLSSTSTSLTCIIKCETCSGSTVVDTQKCTITLSGSDSALKPTLSVSYSPTTIVLGTTSAATSVSITVTVGTKYNATITGGSLTYYSGGARTSKTITSTTTFTTTLSSNSYTCYVTDSRGETTSISGSFGGSSYTAPTIAISATAPTVSGSYASTTVTVSGSYYGNGTTISSVKYRYKVSGGSYPSSYTSLSFSTSNNNYTASVTLSSLQYQSTYIIQCVVTDSQGGTGTATYTISTKPVFYWNGTDFYFNANAHFAGTADFSGDATFDSGTTATFNSDIALQDGYDYVVDYGSTGIWSWRKWKSGYADCWGTYTGNTNSLTVTDGSYIRYSNSVTVSWPFTFSALPTVSYSGFVPDYVAWAVPAGAESKTAAQFKILSMYTGTTYGSHTYYVKIHAFGKT